MRSGGTWVFYKEVQNFRAEWLKVSPIRLQQLRAGIDSAYFAHREHRGAQLINQGAREGEIIARVWMPMPVQTAEPRRWERFINRSVKFNPGMAFGYGGSEPGKLV